MMKNRNKNIDNFIHWIRYNNRGQHTENVIEKVWNRYRFNVGYANIHYFDFEFPNNVLQIELSWETKFPKFTKFAGETSESKVEGITRYLIEYENLVNDEYLKIKYSIVP